MQHPESSSLLITEAETLKLMLFKLIQTAALFSLLVALQLALKLNLSTHDCA